MADCFLLPTESRRLLSLASMFTPTVSSASTSPNMPMGEEPINLQPFSARGRALGRVYATHAGALSGRTDRPDGSVAPVDLGSAGRR